MPNGSLLPPDGVVAVGEAVLVRVGEAPIVGEAPRVGVRVSVRVGPLGVLEAPIVGEAPRVGVRVNVSVGPLGVFDAPMVGVRVVVGLPPLHGAPISKCPQATVLT